MTLSEPGEARKYKLTDKLEVTLWDRIELEMEKSLCLADLFEEILKKYDLVCRDVFYGNRPIYLDKMASANIDGKEKTLKKGLLNDLLNLDENDAELKYVDLTVTYSKKDGGDELLKNTPEVRIKFK